MSSLKELCNELDKIEPGQLVNLEGEVKPHDNIAGIASVEIKRICTLRANTADAGIKLSRRIMLANNPDEVAKLEEEITRTDKKCDLLDSLLWFALRDEFKLWGKHSVGIKKGFVVVWADETSKENEEKSKLLEDKEPGSCDKNCANCTTGHALTGAKAGGAAGSEIMRKLIPLILLSKLAEGLGDLSKEE